MQEFDIAGGFRNRYSTDFSIQNFRFILQRRGSSQNSIYRGSEYPHALRAVPPNDLKTGVWCAVSARRITRPMFFHETINSERYVRLILPSVFDQLADEEKSYANCIQDYAKARRDNNSTVALDYVFEERVIIRGLWPPRSPDLNPCNFCMARWKKNWE
jgi:hypothetical protein